MTGAGDFCSLLYRLAEEHNGQDVRLTLSGVPLLVVQDASSAHRVLRTNAGNYDKNMPWFRQALGASRMTENGAAWRLRQQLSQPHLARFERQRTFEACTRHAAVALERLLAAGEPRIDDGIFREMAAAVMLESLFGRSLEQAGVDIADIARMIAFGSAYAFMPPKERTAFAPDELRAFLDVRARVLNALRSFRAGEAEPDSLLARLRAAGEAPGNGFVLEHELTLFFAAGAETTAAGMGWACFLLARNPEIQEALRRAVDDAGPAGAATWDVLADIAPLRNFVDEVLRIFPPTPVIGRRAVGADVIGSHEVAAGDQVLVSIVGIQHDRRTRPDPWQVDLDAAPASDAHAAHSVSFGIGPRVCGGARFAMLEMVSFLAAFLRGARFAPTSTAAPQFRWQSQLLHDGGQPVRAVAR